MDKKHFLIALNFMLLSLGVMAQVSVSDGVTVKYGSGDNIIGSDNVGDYGQTYGVDFSDGLSSPGLKIEQGNDESSGIFLNGDKIIMWSPGDNNLVNFCDEDNMDGSWTNGLVAYIDDAGYYFQVSDSTSKENIVDISSPLSKVVKLRGVEYNHKNSGNKSEGGKTLVKTEKKNALRSGFLAQEVEGVIPEAVATNKDGKKYVNYQAIIPFLVEAVKEQQATIGSQAEQIKLLQEQVTQMNVSIKKLQAAQTSIK